MSAPALERPLYLISDGGRLRASGTLVRRISDVIVAARGLVGFIQIRELGDSALGIPPACDAEILEIVNHLQPIAAESGAKILLNSAFALVSDGVGDGIHVRGDLAEVQRAKSEIERNAVVGYSAHSVEEVVAAEAAGADYVLLAPIFAPLSKIHHRSPLGLPALRTAAAATNIPLFALGGVTPQSASECRAAGASGIAAISSLLTAESADALAHAWFTAPR